MKKLFNCGYKCLVSACRFNDLYVKNKYKKIKYENGVSMSNLKDILEEKVNVEAYRLENLSFVCSNMIVHTYYKDKGHYIYIIKMNDRYVYLYDPRKFLAYKKIKKEKLNRYINENRDIHYLLIKREVNISFLINKMFMEFAIIYLAFFYDVNVALNLFTIIILIKVLKDTNFKN